MRRVKSEPELLMAGLVLETVLGRAWTAALFFLEALGGSILSIALNPPTMVSVGASGASVAMLAAAFGGARTGPDSCIRITPWPRPGRRRACRRASET